MSRRIDIELTSSRPDGSFTWRAAGAREPKGVVEGSILPDGAKVGDELKVEVEQELEGLTVLGVVHGRAKTDRGDVLELLPSDRPFEPVTEQRARRDDRGPRRPRRDDRGDRSDRGDRDGRGDRGPRRDDGKPHRDGAERADRGDRTDRAGRGGDRTDRPPRQGGERRPERRQRPHFTPPPELPQRPKPKRLRPASAHRSAVLASLPEEQRPIAELALQGLAAVRQRLRDENRKLTAAGKPPMPEASVLKLAEELLPTLRVAEWLDRAEAAQRQLEHLDLRDLRSVVAASDDPMVARDESTRELADTLRRSLVTKQEQELELWFADIDAALGVGRVIRALRLSSQPPKAGVPFPAELAARLAEAAAASLTPTDSAERWAAVLEAAAFSPVRAHIVPTAPPQQTTNELRATMTRLAPALPQVAALLGIEVAPDAPMPKPLRPQPRPKPAKEPTKESGKGAAKEPAKGSGKAPKEPRDAQAHPEPEPEPDREPDHEPLATEADGDEVGEAEEVAAVEETPADIVETPTVEVVEETPTVEVVEETPAETVVEETPAETVVEETPAEIVVEAPPAEIVETPTVEVIEETPAEIVDTPTVEVVEEPPAHVVDTPTVEVIEETPAQIVDTPSVEVVEETPAHVVEDAHTS